MNQNPKIEESTDCNLDRQYQYYLQRVNLNEATMSPVQRVETKRAFFAACGQMLILMRDGIGNIENESDAIRTMDDLLNQVGNFWIKQAGRGN